jgi:hypothetical protein
MESKFNIIITILLCISMPLMMGCGASNALKGGAIDTGAGGVVGGTP